MTSNQKLYSFDQLTGRCADHLITYQDQLLHPSIIPDFEKLQADGKKQSFDLKIASSYRSYERQLTIWNEKIEGKRALLDKNGIIVDVKQLNSETILDLILMWSTIPGSSRHHWGTDLDLFDSSCMPPSYQLQLTDDEYTHGVCKNFNLFIEKKIMTQFDFPFFRPYCPHQGKIGEEKWHFSHRKISHQYYQNYSLDVFIENLNLSNIYLKEIILKNPTYYYQHYFKI